MATLSSMQQKILQYLTSSLGNGKVPTIREIGQAVGLHSTSSVHAQLRMLEKKGYIRRTPNKSRSIELVGTAGATSLAPLVGKVRAGKPNLAQEEWIGFFPLPDAFRGSDCFVLQVKGDSMIEAGIHDKDYVIVRRQSHAHNGEIVIALIGEEATLKRIHRTADSIILEACNPKYPPISVQDVQILGKVVGLFRLL